MSANSINRAANDPQLQARIVAGANKEILFNAELFDSWFGQQIRRGMAMWLPLYWAVAVETEAAYEAALLAQRGAPGFDNDVITDAALVSAITANWPVEIPLTPPVLTPTAMPATPTNPATTATPTPTPAPTATP